MKFVLPVILSLAALVAQGAPAPAVRPAITSSAVSLGNGGASNAKIGGIFAGPIIVGNGGGIGEFYLFYSLRMMHSLISVCQAEPTCAGGIESILSALDASHLYDSASLQLLTSRELGKDLVRVNGDQLSINKDLLFVNRDGAGPQPWLEADALAFYASTWAPRLGLSGAQAALLGQRLGEMADATSERVPQSEFDLHRYTLVFFEEPFSSVVIEDNSQSASSNSFEIPFASKVTCGVATGSTAQANAMKITSAQWGATNRTLGGEKIAMQVSGSLTYACGAQSFAGQYKVFLNAIKAENGWQIDVNSIAILQTGVHATP